MSHLLSPLLKDRVRALREHQSWSQSELAERLGTTSFMVSRWERGVVQPGPYYRRRLCDVFGVTLQDLGFQIQDHKQGDASVLQSTPLSWPTDPPPALLTGRFLGREVEIAQAIMHLQTPAHLALLGLPGVGKTSLARFLAHHPAIHTLYPDGVLWIGLGIQPEMTTLFGGLAKRLGVGTQALVSAEALPALRKVAQAALNQRRCLLIIDDAWTIEAVTLFTIGGSQCATILTTRFPPLAHAFALDRTIRVAEFDEERGVLLLQEQAPGVVEQELDACRELVRAVGGLPLALLLLGRGLQAQALSRQPRRVRNLLRQLRQAEQRLQLSDPFFPKDIQNTSFSLHAAIGESAAILTINQQQLLINLAILPPKPEHFTEETGFQISGMPFESFIVALDGLVDAGLVESIDPGRYTFHQTIADFARPVAYSAESVDRLLTYACNLLVNAHDDYRQLAEERALVTTAIEVAYRNRRRACFCQLVRDSAYFWLSQGWYVMAEDRLREALAIAVADRDQENASVFSTLLATVAKERGDLAAAEQLANAGLTFAEQGDSSAMAAGARHILGTVAIRRGDLTAAHLWFTEGLLQIRAQSPLSTIQQGWELSLLLGLGNNAYHDGKLDVAEGYYREGLSRAEELGRAQSQSAFWQCLGVIAGIRGQYAAASQAFTAALGRAQQSNNYQQISALLANLANVAIEEGRLEDASPFLKEALTIARRIGHHDRECGALSNLASLAIQREEYTRAEAYVHEGIALAEAMGNRERLAPLLLDWVRITRLRGEAITERRLFACLEKAKTCGVAWVLPDFSLELGEWYATQRKWAEALSAFHDARQGAEMAGTEDRVGSALFGMARVTYELGQKDEAILLAEEGLAIGQRLHSRQRTRIAQWLHHHKKASTL